MTNENFKIPDNWVDEGRETYYSTDGEPVFIGLDFGTCFTKASIRLRDQLHVVTWEGITRYPINYLLPSEISFVNKDFVIGGAQKVHSNLKTELFNQEFRKDSDEAGRVCIFLALVLRYIRAWVYRHLGKHFRKGNIKWGINVGLPAENSENSIFTETYEAITRIAWLISKEKHIDWYDVMNLLQHPPPLEAVMLDYCEAKPEFVAQLAGYIQSPQRENGLHLLVDIGGGTLDVVSFIIQGDLDNEDEYNILWPSVTRTGTQALNSYRCKDTGIEVNSFLNVLDTDNFAIQYKLATEKVRTRDLEFQKQVNDKISRVLHITKQKRYIRAPEWQNGLKVFISGGGRHIGLYRYASLDAANSKTKKFSQLFDLPTHPDLTGFHDFENYSRVSVACGLGQDPFNFGIIRYAKDIMDDETLNIRNSNESVTKDMV